MTKKRFVLQIQCLFCLTGEVIKEGDIKCIYNEGMPQYKNPFEKGKLVIKFTVSFPEDNWIPEDRLAALESLLPARQQVP